MSKPIKIGIIFLKEKLSKNIFNNFFNEFENKINCTGYIYTVTIPTINGRIILKIKNKKNHQTTLGVFKIDDILYVPKSKTSFNACNFVKDDIDCYIFLSGFDDCILDQDEYTIDNVIQSF